MARRSISCGVEDDLLSWWCMHAVAPDALLRNASAYTFGSARLLCLNHDCLHAVVRRLLDESEAPAATPVGRAAVLAARRALRSVAALTCTCITMREVLRAWGPLGALRLEAMARLGLACRWSINSRLDASALRFRDCEERLRSGRLYALPRYFDEAVEAGAAAVLERAVAMKTPRGPASWRLAADCAAPTRSLEYLGAAPFTRDSSFSVHAFAVSILAGGGAHSPVVAVLEGGGWSLQPSGRRICVLGAASGALPSWHAALDDASGLVPHDISSIAVDAQGRAVAAVASDRSPEHRDVQYVVWVWVWRAQGPPLRHVFVPPSALRGAGVAGAYMHAQEAWFGAADGDGALRLFVASSPVHMKLRGECMVNDDPLTERVEASLGADGGAGSHVEAPAVLALRVDAATGALTLVAAAAMEDSAGAAPVDVAHDERGGVAALLMRVTYAAAGNVGAQCARSLAERASAGEHVDVAGDIVGPRFVKLLATRGDAHRPAVRELATHEAYRARRWGQFAHGGPVSVALSPDGRVLATGFVRRPAVGVRVHLDAIDEDGRVVTWRVISVDLPFAHVRATSAATPLVEFSPTGRFVFLRDAAPHIGEAGMLLEVVDLGTYGNSATIVLGASRQRKAKCVRWLVWRRDGLWIAHGSTLLRCDRVVQRSALLRAATFHGDVAP